MIFLLWRCAAIAPQIIQIGWVKKILIPSVRNAATPDTSSITSAPTTVE
ncbi:hypothetical protein INT81_04840 [Riemerella anatipestifer]|nr:hypothetical protein [Riemerella anatipestifer]